MPENALEDSGVCRVLDQAQIPEIDDLCTAGNELAVSFGRSSSHTLFVLVIVDFVHHRYVDAVRVGLLHFSGVAIQVRMQRQSTAGIWNASISRDAM